MSRKFHHEKFVQNLTGSSSFEIFCVVMCCSLFVLLDGLIRILFRRHATHSSQTDKKIRTEFLVDFGVVALPILAILTVFSSFLSTVLVACCVTAAALLLWLTMSQSLLYPKNKNENKNKNKNKIENINENENKNKNERSEGGVVRDTAATEWWTIQRVVIAETRGMILFLTGVAILAVDFSVFPRWMAKTEVAGYSVMDFGVGAFVITNAIVAPQCNEEGRSTLRMVWKEVGDSVVLIALGAGRFVSLAVTDYQSPEAEYGKHWNFFCTLAFVKIFGRIAAFIIHPRYLWLLGIINLFGYELALENGLYESAVATKTGNTQSNAFLGLIFDNLSGLSSCMGFLSLFLIWTKLGRELQKKRTTRGVLVYALESALFALAVSQGLAYLPLPSRRLANTSYVLWTTYLSTVFLSALTLIRLILTLLEQQMRRTENETNSVVDPKSSSTKNSLKETVFAPDLLFAVSFNAMPFFLFANILTGFVNFTIDTTQTSNFVGMGVLTVHVLVLASVATFLHQRKLKIPLRLPFR